jgi:hypothetical protein
LSINDPIEARTSSNTFYGNIATFGLAGGAIQSYTNIDLLVANTIISSSVGNDCAISGLYPSGKHNFSDDTSCYNVILPLNFLLGTALVGVDIDPILQDNGGPTATHMLPSGSAVIDQGYLSCRHPTLGVPLVQDQRGTARPQGIACDVGAVEAQ